MASSKLGLLLLWIVSLSAQVITGNNDTASETGHRIPSQETVPMCEAFHKEAVRLFQQPLRKREYNDRGWMWIRCRTNLETEFDAGGGWYGEWGVSVYDALQQTHCPFTNWQFKYVNKQGWGDAMFRFTAPDFLGCDQKKFIAIAKDLARSAATKRGREFYIWDCLEHRTDRHYGSERPKFPFPGTADGKPPPKKVGVLPKGDRL